MTPETERGIEYTMLHTSAEVCLGRVRIPPDSPLWTTSCLTTPWPGMSFPRTPFRITRPRGLSFVVNPNHVVFVRRAAEYERERVTAAGEASDVVWFSSAFAVGVLADLDPTLAEDPGHFPIPEGLCDVRLRRAQRTLFAYVDGVSDPDPLLVEEATAAMLLHAYSRARTLRGLATPGRTEGTERRHRDAVGDAIAFISANSGERITLGDVADAVGVARFHFCRMFRRITGRTVSTYVRELRLQRALQLGPRYAGRTVDLALAVGYASRAHLSSTFHRWYGEPLTGMERLAEPRALDARLRGSLDALDDTV